MLVIIQKTYNYFMKFKIFYSELTMNIKIETNIRIELSASWFDSNKTKQMP